MKKFFLPGVFFLAMALGAVGAPENWLTDIAAARKLAKQQNLPVLVLFSGTDWCPPCKVLRRDLLDTPEFRAMIGKKCVPLYIHVPRGADPEFSRKMAEFPFVRLQGVPTILVTDPDIGKILVTVYDRSLDGFAAALDDGAKKLDR